MKIFNCFLVIIFFFFSFIFYNFLYGEEDYYYLNKISINGLKYLSKEDILNYLNIKEGKSYSIEILMKIEEKLKNWGYFSFVLINYELFDNYNINLNIELKENKRVDNLIIKINGLIFTDFFNLLKTKKNKPFNSNYLVDDFNYLSSIKYFSAINVDVIEKEESVDILINIERKGKLSFGIGVSDNINYSLFYEIPIFFTSFFIGFYNKFYLDKAFLSDKNYNNYFNEHFGIGFFVGIEIINNLYFTINFENYYDNFSNFLNFQNYEILNSFFYYNKIKLKKGTDYLFIILFNKNIDKYNFFGFDFINKLNFNKFLFYFSLEYVSILEDEIILKYENFSQMNQNFYLTNSNYLKIPFYIFDFSKLNLKLNNEIFINKDLIFVKIAFLYNFFEIFIIKTFFGLFYESLISNINYNFYGIYIILRLSLFNFYFDINIKYGWINKIFENDFMTIDFLPIIIYF
jgi:hypothetical protein